MKELKDFGTVDESKGKRTCPECGDKMEFVVGCPHPEKPVNHWACQGCPRILYDVAKEVRP